MLRIKKDEKNKSSRLLLIKYNHHRINDISVSLPDKVFTSQGMV